MRSATKMTSILAAVGAGALGVGLIGFGSGVGASFSSSATGAATISVGTLDCTLTSPVGIVKISNNGHTANVALDAISGSAADSRLAPLTLTNTGSIPLMATWTRTTSGNILGGSGAIHAADAAASKMLSPGASQSVDIGFTWDDLANEDQGRTGSATYTAACNELPPAPDGISGWIHDGGGLAYWYDGHVVLQTGDQPSDVNKAGVHVTAAPGALPSQQPVFTTTSIQSPSYPRMNIRLSNGDFAFGYPEAANSTAMTWKVGPLGATEDVTWEGVESYVSDKNLTVASAYILLADSTSFTTNITCINYSGTALFGSC